jgi:hypothetical protein
MRSRKVVWHPKVKKLAQVASEGLEYAFVSKDYVQVHQLVWCKDFLQDALYSFLNKKKRSIYGFSYDPYADPPIYMGETRIMLANYRDKDFATKLTVNCKQFLNQIESHLRMTKTQFIKCCNPPKRYQRNGVFIARASRRWMKSPPMISLYTLLVRVGLVHNLGDTFEETIQKVKAAQTAAYNSKHVDSYSNDSALLRRSESAISRILRYGDRKVFHREIKQNFPVKDRNGRIIPISTYHDKCGLCGYSENHTKGLIDHWHREFN